MKLKVTWQDGSWNRDGSQPTATALLPEGATAQHIGEDTLVFKWGGGGSNSDMIVLIVPEQRLISVVLVEDDGSEVQP